MSDTEGTTPDLTALAADVQAMTRYYGDWRGLYDSAQMFAHVRLLLEKTPALLSAVASLMQDRDEAHKLVAWGAEQITAAQAETTAEVTRREQAELDAAAAREQAEQAEAKRDQMAENGQWWREQVEQAQAELVRVTSRFEQLRNKLIPKGFGRRNVHCSNCGDERGGPFGHETSECRYRSGMAAFEVVEIQPEHRRAEFWEVAVDRYLAMELGEFTVTLATSAPQPKDACNCQSIGGGGPWHPMGDTPSCPQPEDAEGTHQASTPAARPQRREPSMWDEVALALLLHAKSVILRAVQAHCSDDPWRKDASLWIGRYAAFTGEGEEPAAAVPSSGGQNPAADERCATSSVVPHGKPVTRDRNGLPRCTMCAEVMRLVAPTTAGGTASSEQGEVAP